MDRGLRLLASRPQGLPELRQRLGQGQERLLGLLRAQGQTDLLARRGLRQLERQLQGPLELLPL
jgi:hypothetical protein